MDEAPETGTIDVVASVTIRNGALDALSPQHRAFVEHYTGIASEIDDPRKRWNAPEAARRAGYGAAGARVRAHELLQRPDVKRAIAEVLADLRDRHEALAQRAIEELAMVAFARLDDVIEVRNGRLELRENITPEAWAAVSELREQADAQGVVRLIAKLHSKPQALALLLRVLGYTDAPTSPPMTLAAREAEGGQPVRVRERGLNTSQIQGVREALGLRPAAPRGDQGAPREDEPA